MKLDARRIKFPQTVFRGHMRSTTLLLIVVFIGLMLAYGQTSAHYQKVDAEKAQQIATERLIRSERQARQAQQQQDEESSTATTTRTRPTTTTPSSSSSEPSTPVPETSEPSSSSSESPAPQTFQLPGGASLTVPRIP